MKIIMNKKIGILSFYYKTFNYGAKLQAYALARYLNINGYDAEQIRFDMFVQDCAGKEKFFERIYRIIFIDGLIKKIKKKCVYILNSCFHKCHKSEFEQIVSKRLEAFRNFSDVLTPHSESVYNASTIAETNMLYDIFIVGSDQVWNFDMSRPEYLLTFVDDDKQKISYAASVANYRVKKQYENLFRENLNRFNSISVREGLSVNLIKRLCNDGKNVKLVCDPTFLLSKTEWEQCVSDKLIKDKYLFCYFLGENHASRELAIQYAKQKNLTVVSIPMVNDGFRFADENFGDVQLNEASPEEFLSLIKFANVVFTDSFHAAVFSLVFRKQFIVFDRDKLKTMSSRITELLSLCNLSNRYADDESKECMDYINNLKEVSYEDDCTGFDKFISDSKNYIKESLNLDGIYNDKT